MKTEIESMEDQLSNEHQSLTSDINQLSDKMDNFQSTGKLYI